MAKSLDRSKNKMRAKIEMFGMGQKHYDKVIQATSSFQKDEADIATGSSIMEGIRYAFAASGFGYEASPKMKINGVPCLYHLTKIKGN
jgi:hypothetical protein